MLYKHKVEKKNTQAQSMFPKVWTHWGAVITQIWSIYIYISWTSICKDSLCMCVCSRADLDQPTGSHSCELMDCTERWQWQTWHTLTAHSHSAASQKYKTPWCYLNPSVAHKYHLSKVFYQQGTFGVFIINLNTTEMAMLCQLSPLSSVQKLIKYWLICY